MNPNRVSHLHVVSFKYNPEANNVSSTVEREREREKKMKYERSETERTADRGIRVSITFMASAVQR